VLIIDTAAGDVLEVVRNGGAHGAVGSGIRYERAAVLGAKPEKIVGRWGFGQPVIQPVKPAVASG
jgi:hypothetical protein